MKETLDEEYKFVFDALVQYLKILIECEALHHVIWLF